MISNRGKPVVAMVAIFLVTGVDLAAGQSSTWIDELPTVDQVRKSTPSGKDPQDTALRLSAAFVVWQDVVEAFTKKSFFDLSTGGRSAPEVKRYFEYSSASTIGNTQGHAVDGVLAYSNTAEFRQEVLSRFLSAASLQAYWTLRRDDLAARQARHAAFLASKAAAASASEESARQASRSSLDSTTPSADPATQRDVQRAKVDLRVFGLPLGKPIRLPSCVGDDRKEPCYAAKTSSGYPEILFPEDRLPRWVSVGGNGVTVFEVMVRDSILVAVNIDVEESDDLKVALTNKYGQPKVRTKRFKNGFGIASSAEEWEWSLPGLHVEFTVGDQQSDSSSFEGHLIFELESVYTSRKARDRVEGAKRIDL